MKIVICEDEPYWSDLLEAAISRWGEGKATELSCKSCRCPKDLLDALAADEGADVAFIDISLGDEAVDGMAVAEHVRKIGNRVPIIFFTGDSTRAVDGYLVEAVGFLCKPIDEKRLAVYLDRILKQKQAAGTVAIASESGVTLLQRNEIVYVEIADHTVRYCTSRPDSGASVRGTLAEAMALLGLEDFVQIHRSYVVSKSKILRIKTTYPYSVVLADGAKTVDLPVSRNHIGNLLEAYSDGILEVMS